MKQHIIIEKAKTNNIPDQIMTPVGCTYNTKKGFCVNNTSNIAMMKSDGPQTPTSKKWDIETGEDQKGE